MTKNSVNSHDTFFKELFSRKVETREFISKIFPVEITNKLKLETLELDTTEYLDNNLRSTFSDLVYNCNYDNDLEIKITLLFEHKSFPASYVHLQLLGYMLKIWKKQLKQKVKMTPIIPIIFYHGQKNGQRESLKVILKT